MIQLCAYFDHVTGFAVHQRACPPSTDRAGKDGTAAWSFAIITPDRFRKTTNDLTRYVLLQHNN
jgi:hypothetical protein